MKFGPSDQKRHERSKRDAISPVQRDLHVKTWSPSTASCQQSRRLVLRRNEQLAPKGVIALSLIFFYSAHIAILALQLLVNEDVDELHTGLYPGHVLSDDKKCCKNLHSSVEEPGHTLDNLDVQSKVLKRGAVLLVLLLPDIDASDRFLSSCQATTLTLMNRRLLTPHHRHATRPTEAGRVVRVLCGGADTLDERQRLSASKQSEQTL